MVEFAGILNVQDKLRRVQENSVCRFYRLHLLLRRSNRRREALVLPDLTLLTANFHLP